MPSQCPQCELAVDAVHKRSEEEGSTSLPPRREDITDTMIFSPSDLVTMICRDVDLNYATRGINTRTLGVTSGQAHIFGGGKNVNGDEHGVSSFSSLNRLTVQT